MHKVSERGHIKWRMYYYRTEYWHFDSVPLSNSMLILYLLFFMRQGCVNLQCKLVAWHSGRMSVCDRRTFPVLCL